jgi:probable rRNA maturation factor
MSLEIEVQYAVRDESTPPESAFRHWASAALSDREGPAAVTIRVVDEAESQALNRDYRGRDRPTNVLSFPFEPPPGVPVEETGHLLGDLVICAAVVEREATEQGKSPAAHWAHMVVHGVLHLCGHDHQTETEAEVMEAHERTILERLGFGDPYDE